MSRPLRVIKQNVTYHCYSRCHGNRDHLKPDYVKKIALLSIKKALAFYNFRLSYIEFANNHFHIIIKTLKGGATISEIMQYIKARTTENYNKQSNCIGTIWNERFKSEIIEDNANPQEKFIRLIWYLSYNSVRKGILGDPRQNPYSSLNIYIEEIHHSNIPITLNEYYLSLAQTSSGRKAIFERYEPSFLINLR